MFHFVDQIGHKLNYLETRQKIISQNIAQNDIDGYQPQDLEPFENMVKTPRQAVQSMTHSKHISASSNYQLSFKVVTDGDGNAEKMKGGSTVSIQKELMKSAQTNMEHQLATNLLTLYKSLFTMAVSRHG